MSKPNNLIFLDFETFYDTKNGYSLQSMATSSYVRDPRYHTHGAAVAMDDSMAPVWIDGADLPAFFGAFDWSNFSIVGHNLAFDGLILTERYGVRPALWVDTLAMARAVIGSRVKSLGLDNLGQTFGIGGKLNAGKALADMNGNRYPTPQMVSRLAEYCIDDVKKTQYIYRALASMFPEGEYKTVSWTIDMAVYPMLLLDTEPLALLEQKEKSRKKELVAQTGLKQTQISSNQQFADILRQLGVNPPVKVSPTTGKESYAFSKQDEDFLNLLDSDDDRIVDLVEARLAVKSTIKETRAHKLITMASEGPLSVVLNYSGAMQTHRLSGGGDLNLQNLPRSTKKEPSLLRKALKAPDGYKLVAADLSQIELRANCKVCGQNDIIDLLLSGGDPYLDFAKDIYNDQTLTKDANGTERTVGKIGELSLGYYAGAASYRKMLRAQAGIRLPIEECDRIVKLYRKKHQMISGAWRIYAQWLEIMLRGEVPYMDHPIYAPIELAADGFTLPSGLRVTFPDMMRYDWANRQPVHPATPANFQMNIGMAYTNMRESGGVANLHAGVFNNNLIQSLARDVNFYFTGQIREHLPYIDPCARVVMSVHDETVVCCREEYADEVLTMMLGYMKTPPPFWPDLPVTAEGNIGQNYMETK